MTPSIGMPWQVCKSLDVSQSGDGVGDATTAEYIRTECWDKLSTGGGWPTVGWREAYVCSLMVLSLEIVDKISTDTGGNGQRAQELIKAMQHLDLALIMGGPAAYELAHQIMELVEPTLQAEAAGQASEGNEAFTLEDYVVSEHLPALAPAIDDARAIRKVTAIPFAEFKKDFFKTDTPVVKATASKQSCKFLEGLYAQNARYQ
jgi:hypothetical protein